LIKEIKGKNIDDRFFEKHTTPIDTFAYNIIVEGMRGAVTDGTSTIAQLPNIEVCAKTGTAQNPHGNNHSVFVTFAPKDNPKIAIAVLVENAGYGAAWAAPIASLMTEKYLTGKIARPELEKLMLTYRYKK